MAKRDKRLFPYDFCACCGGVPDHIHHVFHGTSNRRKADKLGYMIPLCCRCHTFIHSAKGVDMDLYWKRKAQKLFEEEHTREEFRQRFIRSYLED